MKIIWVLLCAFTFLYSEGVYHKLIVSTDKNKQSAQESLLKLKVYFIENPNMRALNEANDFKIELETLGAYTMVVVKPIRSLSIKNSLLMELAPVFPDVFALEEKGQSAVKSHNEPIMSLNHRETVETEHMNTIGTQWFFLALLAIAGLLLAIVRRKKLLLLDEKQKELDIDQKEIENEIKNLGKRV